MGKSMEIVGFHGLSISLLVYPKVFPRKLWTPSIQPQPGAQPILPFCRWPAGCPSPICRRLLDLSSWSPSSASRPPSWSPHHPWTCKIRPEHGDGLKGGESGWRKWHISCQLWAYHLSKLHEIGFIPCTFSSPLQGELEGPWSLHVLHCLISRLSWLASTRL